MNAKPSSGAKTEGQSRSEDCASRRHKVFLRSDIVTGDVRVRAHTLYISEHGALLHVHAPLHARSFHIVLGDQAHRADVMWVDGKKVDVRFTPSLTPEIVNKLIPLISEMIR